MVPAMSNAHDPLPLTSNGDEDRRGFARAETNIPEGTAATSEPYTSAVEPLPPLAEADRHKVHDDIMQVLSADEAA